MGRCGYCGRLLGDCSPNRRYCSPSCKQAAYRARKRNSGLLPEGLIEELESLAPGLGALAKQWGAGAALSAAQLLAGLAWAS